MAENPSSNRPGTAPEEDADLLAMIRQHLAEAESNIQAEKRRAPAGDPNRVQVSSTQETLENIWREQPPIRPAPPQWERPQVWQVPPMPPMRQQMPVQPPPQPPQQPQQPSKKAAKGPQPPPVRKKKKRRARKFFAVLLACVLLLGMLGTGFAYYEAGKVRYGEAIAGDARRPDASQLRWHSLVTNILLIGLDGQETDASLRSDSMLLLSVDRRNGALKLCSFLRDSWVSIPGEGENKLNAAYAWGGPELLTATLEQNFGVRIDHYLQVDFEGFRGIIDALGGIAVPVTEKEIDFLCKTTRLGKQIGKESFRQQMRDAGVVRFTGEQALIYCRIRKLDSDFMRAQRQQKVLGAIVDKLKNENPLKLLALPDEILPYIRTDMSRARLTALLLAAPVYMFFETQRHSVPMDNTYKSVNKKGSAALELDFEANRRGLKEFIYGS